MKKLLLILILFTSSAPLFARFYNLGGRAAIARIRATDRRVAEHKKITSERDTAIAERDAALRELKLAAAGKGTVSPQSFKQVSKYSGLKIAAATAASAAALAKIYSLQKENRRLRKQTNRSPDRQAETTEIMELKQAIETHAKEIENLRNNAKNHKTNCDRLLQEIAAIKAENENIKTNYNLLQEKYTALFEYAETEDTQNQELRELFEKQKAQYDKQVKDYRDEYQENLKALANASEHFRTHEQRLAKTTANVEELGLTMAQMGTRLQPTNQSQIQ
jgi:chromosome segregation ATPase